jgi:hypothetical protein
MKSKFGDKAGDPTIKAKLIPIITDFFPKNQDISFQELENKFGEETARQTIQVLFGAYLDGYLDSFQKPITNLYQDYYKKYVDNKDEELGESKLNEVENKSVLDFVKQNLDSVMGEISNIAGGNSYYKELAKMVKSNPALMSGDENLVQFKDQDEEKELYNTFQVAFNRNKITDGGFKSKIVVDGTKLFITA